MEPFGSKLPWAEPAWYTGIPSPYYTPMHAKFRNWIRKWMHETAAAAETTKDENDILLRFADAGLLLPIGAGSYIPDEYKQYWKVPGVTPEEWDPFFDAIMWDELYREIWTLPSGTAGVVVGIPPLMRFGSDYIKNNVIPDLLAGKKRCCFAVTEPDTGSDMKNVATTAVKTPDGKHYIVNGNKKWITNGGNAHYFTTLVRTGGEGIPGLSVLLVPLQDGVRTRPMELAPDGQKHTHTVSMEDVKVPANHLCGVEGQGFGIITNNMNHERMLAAFQALSLCRTSLRVTVEWLVSREAFGAPLIEQPVIRWKLAQMGRRVESLQTWLESVLYAVKQLPHDRATDKRLGGTTAMLKAQAGMCIKYVGDECQKLFGGNGMTKTGRGREIESIVRRAPLLIVPGGAEDVLLDFGTREALKAAGLRVGVRKDESKL